MGQRQSQPVQREDHGFVHVLIRRVGDALRFSYTYAGRTINELGLSSPSTFDIDDTKFKLENNTVKVTFPNGGRVVVLPAGQLEATIVFQGDTAVVNGFTYPIAPSGFNKFEKQFYHEVSQGFTHLTTAAERNRQIKQELSRRWKDLPEEQKAAYRV